MLLLRTSLVERSYEIGVFIEGSEATIEGSIVRDTQPGSPGLTGRGVTAQVGATTDAPSTLVLVSSLVEQSHQVGVYVAGSEATVEATVVRDTFPDTVGIGGDGVHLEGSPQSGAPSTLLIHASIVEQSHLAGLIIAGSVATIDSCLVRDTTANAAGHFGDGVIVVSVLGPASATVSATRIERSTRAALSAHGAHAAIGGSAMSCQSFDLDSESYKGKAATLEDLGGNLCGCPEPKGKCVAASASLEPPPPLEPP
jgi:hypothetical protein